MDLAGKYEIPAKKEVVWDALNNPNILKKSIKGCESLVKTSDNEFDTKVKAKIGPVSASFRGIVNIKDVIKPNSYTLSGEGKGGAAGFAKGNVKITLEETKDKKHTILNYTGSAQVGGKLAQLGSRLIGGAVQTTADDFFNNFCNLLSESSADKNISPLPNANLNKSGNTIKNFYIPYWTWIFGIILLVGIILAFID